MQTTLRKDSVDGYIAIFVSHMLQNRFCQIEIVVPQRCTCDTSKYDNQARLVGYLLSSPNLLVFNMGHVQNITIAQVWFDRLTFPKNRVVFFS